MTANNLGVAVAADLLERSKQDAAATPMDAVLDGALAGQFTGDHCFRLLARLWTHPKSGRRTAGGRGPHDRQVLAEERFLPAVEMTTRLTP